MRHQTKSRPESQLDTIRKALPGSQNDIVNRTRVSRITVLRWIGFLREAGEAHVGGWEITASRPRPIYHAGFGADVACDKLALDPDERAKVIEARERRMLAAERAKRAAELAQPVRRDPLVAAFFGSTGAA